MYDGYAIYDGDTLFDKGKIVDLQFKYETFGVLVENEWKWLFKEEHA